MEQLIFDRLCIMNNEYKAMGPDKVSELVEAGRQLIELHGEENLQYKLKTEQEFLAAGIYFEWRLATNEELYEGDTL